MKLFYFSLCVFIFSMNWLSCQMKEPAKGQVREQAFLQPGVIIKAKDKWIGSDYLGFLDRNIGIEIEVIQSHMQGEALSINQPYLESRVSDIFRSEGINPAVRAGRGRPPLPFFHILILVYAIPRNAYLIFCAARLFEEVKVMREKFVPTGDWQAITWETQELVIAQKDKALIQIQDLVDEVTNSFVKRYRAYNPIPPEYVSPPIPTGPRPPPGEPRFKYPSLTRPPAQQVPASPRGGGGGGY